MRQEDRAYATKCAKANRELDDDTLLMRFMDKYRAYRNWNNTPPERFRIEFRALVAEVKRRELLDLQKEPIGNGNLHND